MFYRASMSRAFALAMAVCLVSVLGVVSGASAAGVERVPMGAQGEPIGSKSANPALSYDGRFLVFQSAEDGLTPDDDNGVVDVYLFDYEMRGLVRASGDFLGAFGEGDSVNPAISADGRFVVFASDSNALNLPIDAGAQTVDVIDTNDARDIFVYDRELGRTMAVSVRSDGRLLDGESDHPSISGDGRYVAFQSRASTPGDPGGPWRIFVHDRDTGVTRMISEDALGRSARLDSERPAISADGRYVAFESDAALVAADRNGRRDVYRYDLRDGRIELVSVSSTGEVGNAVSRGASINADGSMIAFESGAGNLVVGDTNLVPDVFVRDMRVRATHRVSVGADGEQGDGSSRRAAINADGSVVLFESFALTLTGNDRPRKPEDAGQGFERSSVYMHSMADGGRTVMVAEGQGRAARATQTRDGDGAISGNGETMVFTELPLHEEPENLVGGVLYGELNRFGTCLNAPDFVVSEIFVEGVMQSIGSGSNEAVSVRPGEALSIKLEALDTVPCNLETMQIRLLSPTGGDVLPGGMTFIKDSTDCFAAVTPIASGFWRWRITTRMTTCSSRCAGFRTLKIS